MFKKVWLLGALLGALFGMAAFRSQAVDAATVAARSPTEIRLMLDFNGNPNAVNRGDSFYAAGRVLNAAGTELGSWQGLTTVGDANAGEILGLVNWSIRLTGKGSVTVGGAAYPDGSPFKVNGAAIPAIPITGVQGSKLSRVKGSVGLKTTAEDFDGSELRILIGL